jgi:hypothetical protein
MKSAYEFGAIGTAPAVPSSPSVGFPTGGNPGTGTPATTPGAHWYHAVTMEIVNTITAAGLTPDLSDLTQLRQAIALMAPASPVVAVVNFDGTGSVGAQTLRYARNVASVVKVSTGKYELTFATPLPHANYVVACNASDIDTTSSMSRGMIACQKTVSGCFLSARIQSSGDQVDVVIGDVSVFL